MFLTQNGFLTATIALRRWLVNEQQRPDPFFGPPILQLFKGILIYHVVGAEMLFSTSQTVLALVCSTDKTEMWTFFFPVTGCLLKEKYQFCLMCWYYTGFDLLSFTSRCLLYTLDNTSVLSGLTNEKSIFCLIINILIMSWILTI